MAAAWLKGKVGLRRNSWGRAESYLRRHVLPFFGGTSSITEAKMRKHCRAVEDDNTEEQEPAEELEQEGPEEEQSPRTQSDTSCLVIDRTSRDLLT